MRMREPKLDYNGRMTRSDRYEGEVFPVVNYELIVDDL